MSLCYLLCLCKYTDFSLKQTNEFISLSRQTHLNYTDYPIPEKSLPLKIVPYMNETKKPCGFRRLLQRQIAARLH